MMKGIRNSSLLVLMLALVMAFASGCKSKKKAAEAARAAEERARMEQAALEKEKEEERKRKEAEENALRDEEARKMAEPKARLTRYFEAIAASGNLTAANGSINEALTLFASPDTPVLIVISEENGQKDYDRPTTIRDYLNYLKDQRKNINTISNLQFDASGKITEVELRKK